MIAYKTYQECPPSIKPANIPNEMVWLLEEIEDYKADLYLEAGYTVVALSEYYQYLSTIAPIESAYLNQIAQQKAYSEVELKIQNILRTNQIEGLNLILDFGKRNMLLGKTESQIDLIMEDSDVLKLCMALISGSYKYALRKCDQINNPAITESDKQYFKDKITDILTRK